MYSDCYHCLLAYILDSVPTLLDNREPKGCPQQTIASDRRTSIAQAMQDRRRPSLLRARACTVLQREKVMKKRVASYSYWYLFRRVRLSNAQRAALVANGVSLLNATQLIKEKDHSGSS